ncbi:MAG: lipid-A-disaccharide synthase, partial [Elusimicrobia bacterium]|nr:lipid-A-disaccharide synthase [Elusimicrobiota bacterium]
MTRPKYILITAGDPSGDLHGSRLARALKHREPGLKIAAIGGKLLEKEADVFFEDLASLGIVGFVEPLRQLPRLLALLRRVGEFLLRERPLALVCIDYYGFNRRVLPLAKRAGVPAFYFISPQVWASRPGRLKVLKRFISRMLLIFPFERRVYHEARIAHSFVGHPLLDLLPEPKAAKERSGLKIGLLPGSRKGEVTRHLPVFLEALERIRKDYPSLTATVFAAGSLPDSDYAAATSQGLELVRETDYRRRASMDFVLTSSGTATLENALLGLPMVVIYKLSWPTYAIARAIVKVPYISMANLLAGKALVPELIQRDATGESVAAAALSVLEDSRKFDRVRRELLAL